MLKNKKGFTLVEIIVVIAVLGVLIGVSLPVFSWYLQSADIATDKANAAFILRTCQLIQLERTTADKEDLKDGTAYLNEVKLRMQGQPMPLPKSVDGYFEVQISGSGEMMTFTVSAGGIVMAPVTAVTDEDYR